MITLRQLRYLAALAKHGHFGRAAEACNVTQPALSMQIRDLERTLGVKVVERPARRGDADRCRARSGAARRGRAGGLARPGGLCAASRRTLTGRLTLGVIPSLAPYLLPRILPVLQKQFPELRLELRETQTRQLVDDIKSGALDAAMLALPLGEPEIDTAKLFDDLFLLAVPADDPRPADKRIKAMEIDQSRLILLEDGHCLRDQALAFCATAARGHRVRRQRHGLRCVQPLHGDADGRQRLWRDIDPADRRRSSNNATSAVKFLRLEDPQPGRTIGLAFRRTSPRKADFAALGDVVKDSVIG